MTRILVLQKQQYVSSGNQKPIPSNGARQRRYTSIHSEKETSESSNYGTFTKTVHSDHLKAIYEQLSDLGFYDSDFIKDGQGMMRLLEFEFRAHPVSILSWQIRITLISKAQRMK